jgi:hypothetical protein
LVFTLEEVHLHTRGLLRDWGKKQEGGEGGKSREGKEGGEGGEDMS